MVHIKADDAKALVTQLDVVLPAIVSLVALVWGIFANKDTNLMVSAPVASLQWMRW